MYDPGLSLHQLQLLVFFFTGGVFMSLIWLVTYARDVVLVLQYVLPLDPGEGRRHTTPKAVCAALTIFGFSFAADSWVMLRAGWVF